MSAFDMIDYAILKALNQDARMSSAEIARQVGVPERTIHNRMRRLIESGCLRTVGMVNPRAFGYSLAVDIFCEVELGLMNQAVQALAEMSEVSYLAISTGDQDISLQALFKSIEEMQDFITNKLHPVPGLRRTRTVLIPRIVKDSFMWLPPEESFAGERANGDERSSEGTLNGGSETSNE